MQYERIILELLDRIKILEASDAALNARVAQLELQVQEFETQCSRSDAAADAISQDHLIGETTALLSADPDQEERQRLTGAMIDACYESGRRLYQGGGANFRETLDALVAEVGMKRSSAVMYVYAVKDLLSGTVYKRAISLPATERFFQLILRDYGKEGLARALQAARAHIAYRQRLHHTVDGLIRLCAQYEDLLSE